MFGRNCFRSLITSFTAVAVLLVYSSVGLAGTKDITGELTVSGQVSVNGQNAVSNSTIVSGSTIVTGQDSSAVISLGKTGRVELQANSNLVLNFSETGIVGILSSGKALVANAAGVATTFTTKDSTVIADAGQANNFVVEVECSHTHVDTTSGLVTMREGTNDKQVAAGTSAVAGNLAQTGCVPCLRPGGPLPLAFAGPIWLILAAAGVAAAAILLGSKNKPTITGPPPIIISPSR